MPGLLFEGVTDGDGVRVRNFVGVAVSEGAAGEGGGERVEEMGAGEDEDDVRGLSIGPEKAVISTALSARL